MAPDYRFYPLSPRLLYNKAEALRVLGRVDEARDFFDKVRIMDPNFPGLYESLDLLGS